MRADTQQNAIAGTRIRYLFLMSSPSSNHYRTVVSPLKLPSGVKSVRHYYT